MIDTINILSSTALSDVVSTADCKAHLRVLHSDEDALIGAYRDAACEYVQNYCGVRLTNTSAQLKTSRTGGIVELPIAPLKGITHVKYKASSSDTLTTFDASNYTFELSRVPAVVKFNSSMAVHPYHVHPVEITVNCGYASGAVPAPILQAIKFLVGHFYENRESSMERKLHNVPFGVHALLNPYRIISFL